VDAPIFSKSEFERYSRHLIIPEFNIKGQQKLKSAAVLVIGAGGLGCPVLQYLTAAGVGTIGMVDFDVVSESNLQRQILYDVTQVGEKKVYAAEKKLTALNPHVQFHIHDLELSSSNALGIIEDYDVVIDGTDNFPTRYLVNDACVIADKPLVYGSIFQFEGQVSVFNLANSHSRGPNYRDLFPTPPPPDLVPNCAEGGVLGVLPGIIGSLQANEAIKIIANIGDTLSGRLFVFDALTFTSVTLNIPLDPIQKSIDHLIDYNSFCHIKPASHDPSHLNEISVHQLKIWLDNGTPFQLVDVRNIYEYDIANISGTLIPLSELEQRHDEINRACPVVIHCRSGKRSKEAIQILRDKYGFDNLLNLSGGILAYSKEINNEIPTY